MKRNKLIIHLQADQISAYILHENKSLEELFTHTTDYDTKENEYMSLLRMNAQDTRSHGTGGKQIDNKKLHMEEVFVEEAIDLLKHQVSEFLDQDISCKILYSHSYDELIEGITNKIKKIFPEGNIDIKGKVFPTKDQLRTYLLKKKCITKNGN